jgi:hypothetical protein
MINFRNHFLRVSTHWIWGEFLSQDTKRKYFGALAEAKRSRMLIEKTWNWTLNQYSRRHIFIPCFRILILV